MQKKRKCEICGKNIIVKIQCTYSKIKSTTSKEGKSFRNAWFCNLCWKELQKTLNSTCGLLV